MARKSKSRSARRRQPDKAGGVITHLRRTVVVAMPKTASDSGQYRRISLADLSGSTDITSLFSQYKIERLRYTYRLVNAPNNNASFPTIYFAPQSYSNSGSSPGGGAGEVLQFKNLKTYQFGPANISTSVTFVPSVPIDAGNTVSMGAMFSPVWLNTQTNNVYLPTVVEWISRYNSTTDPTHTLELQIDAWISARGTR